MGKAPTGRGTAGRRVVACSAEAVFLSKRRASVPELAVALGAVLATAGGVLLVWGLFGGSDTALRFPPAVAQEIPRDVGTAAPAPVVMVTAPPMAASVPIPIEIPAVKVDAPVTRLDLNANGTVQVPPLQRSQPGRLVRPVRHARGKRHVRHPRARRRLRRALGLLQHQEPAQGRRDLRRAGRRRHGGVRSRRRAEGRQDQLPDDDVYGNVPYPTLRLVTCGGPFDATTGEYQDNIVVYAHLAASG